MSLNYEEIVPWFEDVPLYFRAPFFLIFRVYTKGRVTMKRLIERVPLEQELHEGDGPIPRWIWLVVACVALFAALFAPFQLFWTVGG